MVFVGHVGLCYPSVVELFILCARGIRFGRFSPGCGLHMGYAGTSGRSESVVRGSPHWRSGGMGKFIGGKLAEGGGDEKCRKQDHRGQAGARTFCVGTAKNMNASSEAGESARFITVLLLTAGCPALNREPLCPTE